MRRPRTATPLSPRALGRAWTPGTRFTRPTHQSPARATPASQPPSHRPYTPPCGCVPLALSPSHPLTPLPCPRPRPLPPLADQQGAAAAAGGAAVLVSSHPLPVARRRRRRRAERLQLYLVGRCSGRRLGLVGGEPGRADDAQLRLAPHRNAGSRITASMASE